MQRAIPMLLMFALVSCSTSSSENAQPGKADGLDSEVPCTTDELAVASTCFIDCRDVPDAETCYLECVQAKDTTELSTTCLLCLEGVPGELAHECSVPEAEVACEDGELSLMLVCHSLCEDSTSPTCLEEVCSAELEAVSQQCQLCVGVNFADGEDFVEAACGPEEEIISSCDGIDVHACDDDIFASGTADDCPLLDDQAALSMCCVENFDFSNTSGVPLCEFIDEPSLEACEAFREAAGDEWEDCLAFHDACDIPVDHQLFLDACCTAHDGELQCF